MTTPDTPTPNWPTDLLNRAERRLADLAADLDDWDDRSGSAATGGYRLLVDVVAGHARQVQAHLAAAADAAARLGDVPDLAGLVRTAGHLVDDIDGERAELARPDLNLEDEDGAWLVAETRGYLHTLQTGIEAAGGKLEPLEWAAGQPKLSHAEAVADIADRLTWGRRR